MTNGNGHADDDSDENGQFDDVDEEWNEKLIFEEKITKLPSIEKKS